MKVRDTIAVEKKHQAHFIVRLAAAAFYLLCLMQWLWAVVPYLPSILRLYETIRPIEQYQPPSTNHTVTDAPSLLVIIIASIITILILALTVYILVKLPSAVTRTGQKITQRTVDYSLPLMTHHKTISVKKRKQLSSRLLFASRFLLCTLPVAVSLFSFSVSLSLDYSLVVMIAAALSIVNILILTTLSYATYFHQKTREQRVK